MRSLQVAPLTLLDACALRRIAVALVAAALVIVWIGRYTDIDLLLADAVFDGASRTFPWQHTWLAETVGHVIVKWLLMLAALGFIGCAAIDAAWPSARCGVLDRLRLRVVAASALLVPFVVSSLKQASASHCPWDLARYGGGQPYVRIFDALPVGAVPGHCLPAGHASSALWLLSLAVWWLPARPSGARLAALAGIACGALLGVLQQLRGAHFLTHTLWSIWIACAIVAGVTALLQRMTAIAERPAGAAALRRLGG